MCLSFFCGGWGGNSRCETFFLCLTSHRSKFATVTILATENRHITNVWINRLDILLLCPFREQAFLQTMCLFHFFYIFFFWNAYYFAYATSVQIKLHCPHTSGWHIRDNAKLWIPCPHTSSWHIGDNTKLCGLIVLICQADVSGTTQNCVDSKPLYW